MRGDGFPEGFSVPHADAAGLSLRRKRAQAVREAWPALSVSLGERFEARFDAFARTTGAPAWGHGLIDGLTFVLDLEDELAESARVELLLVRAIVRRDRTGVWRSRRGVRVELTRLRAPHRLLVMLLLPRLGRRRFVLALGPRERLGR